jgi:hypothetical protein
MAVQVITFDMEMDSTHHLIIPDGTFLGISRVSDTPPVGVLAIRLDGGQQTKMNNNNLHHIVSSLALVKVYRSASPIFLER